MNNSVVSQYPSASSTSFPHLDMSSCNQFLPPLVSSVLLLLSLIMSLIFFCIPHSPKLMVLLYFLSSDFFFPSMYLQESHLSGFVYLGLGSGTFENVVETMILHRNIPILIYQQNLIYNFFDSYMVSSLGQRFLIFFVPSTPVTISKYKTFYQNHVLK